jgi:hypothetical protein
MRVLFRGTLTTPEFLRWFSFQILRLAVCGLNQVRVVREGADCGWTNSEATVRRIMRRNFVVIKEIRFLSNSWTKAGLKLPRRLRIALDSPGLAQPFFSNSIQEGRGSADEVGAPPFSASFAERVGAKFPIWNRLQCPLTFLLTHAFNSDNIKTYRLSAR